MICSAKPMPVKVQLFTLVAAHGPEDPVKFPCLAESWGHQMPRAAVPHQGIEKGDLHRVR